MPATGSGHVLLLRPGDSLPPDLASAGLRRLEATPGAVACLFAAGRPPPGPMPPERLLAAPLGPVALLARRADLARIGADAAPATDMDDWLVALIGQGTILRQGGLQAGPPDAAADGRPVARRRACLERLGLARDWDIAATPGGLAFRRRPGRRLVLTWPDYSAANPYQRLLYAPLAQRFEVCAAPPAAAIEIAREAALPEPPVLHLHWLNFVFRNARGPGAARDRGLALLDQVAQFRALGGRLVWTVHNLASHDSRFAAVEHEISARLAAACDAVILHAPGAAEEVARAFALPTGRVHVARHGHFIGAYPETTDRATARAALDLPAGAQVLALFGRLQGYKGPDLAWTAFARLADDHPQAVLLIAGEVADPALLPPPHPRIRLLPGFVPSDRVQMVMRAADALVLPYREMLTSGAALLALGFGVPVVAPEVAMTAALLGHCPDAGLLYPQSGGTAALGAALRQMLARLDRGDGPAMSAAARALALTQTWPDIGNILAG